MRSFVLAVIVAIVPAIGFAVVLSSFQKTAEMEFKTEGVRL
jgi:mannose/fructose/N-acetylgalactosamine-specific phosphotransferase system component IIC